MIGRKTGRGQAAPLVRERAVVGRAGAGERLLYAHARGASASERNTARDELEMIFYASTRAWQQTKTLTERRGHILQLFLSASVFSKRYAYGCRGITLGSFPNHIICNFTLVQLLCEVC